jgi:hypothetical protein
MTEVTVEQLSKYMASASLTKHGDAREQGAASLLSSVFPSSERFWRTFVLPYRESASSVRIRTDLPRSHEAVCIYNYSVMRTCIRVHSFWREAQRRYETAGDTGSDVFEDFFTRMATGLEQCEQFICCVYVALVLRQRRDDVKVMDWRQKRIEEPAKAWMLGLGDGQLRAKLDDFVERVDRYRNHIVHGPKWPGHENRVLRPASVHELIYWSAWAEAMQDGAKWEAETTDRFTVISETRDEFFSLLEAIWSAIVADLVSPSKSVANGSLLCFPLHQVAAPEVLDLPRLVYVSTSASPSSL